MTELKHKLSELFSSQINKETINNADVSKTLEDFKVIVPDSIKLHQNSDAKSGAYSWQNNPSRSKRQSDIVIVSGGH